MDKNFCFQQSDRLGTLINLPAEKCFFKCWIRYFLSLLNAQIWASLVAQTVKNLPARQETRIQSLGWEDPLEKETATHSLPGESHGQRSPAGYSLWDHKESDTTERLTHAMCLHIGLSLQLMRTSVMELNGLTLV